MSGPTDARPVPRRTLVVMGVSASGKSSVGAALARLLGLDFIDGDDLHPAANVTKMAAGHPLTDEDRAPWLDRVGTTLADRSTHPAGLVVACSALRRMYRDRIRATAGHGLVFVFLDITPEEARARILHRPHHFMPASLVESQFATLEKPDGETDVITITPADDAVATATEAAKRLSGRDPRA